jgi:GNAT superfamily N-acetyltransferase
MSESQSFTIRRAEPADAPVLGRLGAVLVRQHHAFDRDRFMAPSPDVERGYAAFLRHELNDADVVVLVAEVDGAPVAYVYAGLEPRSWKELREPAGFIHDLVVDEPFRRHGIAAALLEAAAAWLCDHGAPRIMLWSAEMNAPARRLFARLGFRATMVEMTRESSPDGRPVSAASAPARSS